VDRTRILRRALELKFKGKKRDDPEMMDQPDTGRH
jgi:hypothetical protein